jgi:drug/metabolite transporter (DMT)-like permease
MSSSEEHQVPLNTIPDNTVKKPKTIWNRCHEHSGIWYMLTANIIFACCTFSLKLIPADMFDIMIVRFLIQTVVFGSYAAFYKHYNVFNTNGQPIACAMNILMSSGTNLSYLAAFYFLPLSDLNTIKYTYIVWAAILSVIFLKDRFKVINGISLILTIFGLLLATKPQFLIKISSHIFDQTPIVFPTNTTSTNISSAMAISPYYYVGVIFAFISSLTKAIQMIARKKLVATKQPYSVMNFQFTILALIVALLYSIIRRFWQPSPYPWKWMFTAGVVIGCFQLITNTFYAKALKRENVQLLSILGTLDILYACLLQYIFFRLTKSLIFYIGALFIVISAIILSIDSHLMHKKQREEQLMNENQKTTNI